MKGSRVHVPAHDQTSSVGIRVYSWPALWQSGQLELSMSTEL